MKPYSAKGRETKGQVTCTSNCPTRKRAVKRDKVSARRDGVAETREVVLDCIRNDKPFPPHLQDLWRHYLD